MAFLMNGEPEIVKQFILKNLRLQSWEKKIDRFQLGEGVMPASFKVLHDPVRNTETLVADFGETAIGRVAPVDSGFWWIILLRAYTKSTGDASLAERPECQKGMRLILTLCLSEGFDTFPTLLCADGCSMIDRRMGVYGYPIEIQALFFMALRCALLLLKPDAEGEDFIEKIVKRLHALTYHMRTIEGHEWRIVTGCDPKNTRWSYHNGGSWPAACIKTRKAVLRRAELAESGCRRWMAKEYSDAVAVIGA
ncbi:hypothetical protein Leryth_016998 [Lithospermum erythrorhizon]|nr:hypothetical protein Leryth_016998 [Lithospermum erythrorhizon]